MDSVRSDAQGGINSLLKSQFKQEGILTVTLVDFDTTHETKQRMTSEKFAYELVPRGGTALFDAVGQEIQKTKEDIRKLPRGLRPEKVLFVIVTDGDENSSREYNLASVKSLIDAQKEAGWTFQFIGADDAAWQGQALGINTTKYRNSARGNTVMYATMDSNISNARLKGGSFNMPTEVGETLNA
jgi:hypothetical protein